MASVNKAIIVGNLGQDPELRYTGNQNPVVTLSVATTETWPGKDGQKQEQTEWHRIIVWGKQAENCARYLKKGRPVYVEGRIQTRSWDDKTGQKRYTTEIIATAVQFLGQNQGQQPSSPSIGSSEQRFTPEAFPPSSSSSSNSSMGSFPSFQPSPSLGSHSSSNGGEFDDLPF